MNPRKMHFMRQKQAETPVSFEQALVEELSEIAELRSRRTPSTGTRPLTSDKSVYERAHQARLVGLAFSGGGIRSATFNLGVLQALARLDLLHRVDYLSTVSGGG